MGVFGRLFGRIAAKAAARGITKAAARVAAKSVAKAAAKETAKVAVGVGGMYAASQLGMGRVAEWLRRLTRKSKVRTAVGSNPTLDSLVAVRYTSPGRPEACEGNLVAVAGSCGGVMVKHPWPLLEISLSDFRGLATLNINTYLPTCRRGKKRKRRKGRRRV